VASNHAAADGDGNVKHLRAELAEFFYKYMQELEEVAQELNQTVDFVLYGIGENNGGACGKECGMHSTLQCVGRCKEYKCNPLSKQWNCLVAIVETCTL
jgi:hypothetical protein